MTDSGTRSTTRTIAWDGIAFEVPSNFELARYERLKHGVARIEIEDEFAVRMEAEWIRPRGKREQIDHVLRRYEKSSRQLTLKASAQREIDGLPRGWSATLHVLHESDVDDGRRSLDTVEHSLLTAFYQCPGGSLFVYLLVHLLPENTEDPVSLIRFVAGSFRDHGAQPVTPWRLYDVAFTLSREFELETTRFDLGSKLMIFRRRKRRLLLWHFSCADMILRDGTVMEEWVAGYLNGFSELRGPVFTPGRNGKIEWNRRTRYPLGHHSELSRRCLKYEAHCRLDHARNQLVAWIFNYRSAQDIAMIANEAVLSGGGIEMRTNPT